MERIDILIYSDSKETDFNMLDRFMTNVEYMNAVEVYVHICTSFKDVYSDIESRYRTHAKKIFFTLSEIDIVLNNIIDYKYFAIFNSGYSVNIGAKMIEIFTKKHTPMVYILSDVSGVLDRNLSWFLQYPSERIMEYEISYFGILIIYWKILISHFISKIIKK